MRASRSLGADTLEVKCGEQSQEHADLQSSGLRLRSALGAASSNPGCVYLSVEQSHLAFVLVRS